MRISDWSSDVCSSDLAADFAKVSNQCLGTRPIEHADDELAGIHPLFTRNGLHSFPDRLVEVDDARRIARPHCQLVHVNVGRVQQASFLGNRQHRQRIGASLRSDGRALQRIERDVDPWPLADRIARSDEHTSELQSLMRISYAVFFLHTNNLTTTQ